MYNGIKMLMYCLCDFLGFCRDMFDVSFLLGCDAVLLDNWCSKTTTLPQNTRNRLLSDAVTHPGRTKTPTFYVLRMNNTFVQALGVLIGLPWSC
jgi:hypothetical protein